MDLGGRNGGRIVRSVRQIREWLGEDNYIASLEPKLSGRTNLGRDDAKALFELFLSHWHPGNKVGDEQPYASSKLGTLVDRILERLYPANDSVSQRGLLLPDKRNAQKKNVGASSVEFGREAREVIAELFSDSLGLITVSRNRTVSRSPESIRRFQGMFDELRKIDSRDKKRRILIWIVDIGRRQADDDALRALRNLDALAFQFRATALTENPERQLRWSWLHNNVVVIVGSLQSSDIERCYKILNIDCNDGDLEIPWFDANLLNQREIPENWATTKELRMLYGDSLENLQDRAFSIIPTIPNNIEVGEKDVIAEGSFRYFGHRPPNDEKIQSSSSASRLAIELPIPTRRHNDAFWLAYSAACYRLGIAIRGCTQFTPGKCFNSLKKHHFAVLRLNEFLDITNLVVEK